MSHVTLKVISASLVLEYCRWGCIFVRTRPLHVLLRIESLVRPWSRDLCLLDLLFSVVKSRLSGIETRLAQMLRQKHIVANILAHARWGVWVNWTNAWFIEQTDWRPFVNRVERWLRILHCCAHRCACLVSWLVKLNWACLYHFFRRWTISFYFRPKNSIRLQVLNLLVQLNSFLECISLFHNFSVFYWNHPIVHICWQFIFLDLFLVLKARVSRSEGIHLVTLAHLEA